MSGKLFIVGVGPGHHDHMTFRAKKVIEESDTIVGYTTYVKLVQDLISGKDVYEYAMTQEVERAQQCIDLAKEGKIVSLALPLTNASKSALDDIYVFTNGILGKGIHGFQDEVFSSTPSQVEQYSTAFNKIKSSYCHA